MMATHDGMSEGIRSAVLSYFDNQTELDCSTMAMICRNLVYRAVVPQASGFHTWELCNNDAFNVWSLKRRVGIRFCLLQLTDMQRCIKRISNFADFKLYSGDRSVKECNTCNQEIDVTNDWT